MVKLPEVTVHGRFQPPLHVNHWEYVRQGFLLAHHVTLLITNPFQDEAFEETAGWRNDPINNPYTYIERCWMFKQFFTRMGIGIGEYDFQPFNIKDTEAYSQLDPSIPNLVNVYSPWSSKKADTFQEHGLKVVRLEQPKSVPVSGTVIRSIIANNVNRNTLPEELVGAGFMHEALPGLLAVLANREESHT